MELSINLCLFTLYPNNLPTTLRPLRTHTFNWSAESAQIKVRRSIIIVIPTNLNLSHIYTCYQMECPFICALTPMRIQTCIQMNLPQICTLTLMHSPSCTKIKYPPICTLTPMRTRTRTQTKCPLICTLILTRIYTYTQMNCLLHLLHLP